MTIKVNIGRILRAICAWSLLVGFLYGAYSSNGHTVEKLEDGTIHLHKTIFFCEYDYFVKGGNSLYGAPNTDYGELIGAVNLYEERGIDRMGKRLTNEEKGNFFLGCFMTVMGTIALILLCCLATFCD